MQILVFADAVRNALNLDAITERRQDSLPALGFRDSILMAEKLGAEERAAMHAELERLRQEHRDLDSAIEALVHLSASDQLQIQRLKKRKLILRDKIGQLEDQLTPDIIA
jgi:hypothetical protein